MKIHPHGCLATITYHLMDNITSVVVIMVIIVFVQVIKLQELQKMNKILFQFVGLLFSFSLANSIKKECEVV